MFSFIGKLITQLRLEHSLTIEELAHKSGITPTKLEEIENGKITPSIGVMIKVSRALGSRLGTLLDGQENVGAIVTRAKKALCSDLSISSNVEPADNVIYSSLAMGKSDRHMEPFIVDIQYKGDGSEPFSEHEGEEFLFVLDGAIEIHYGAEVYRLERGDSIYYDCIVPHKLINVTPNSTAKILAVVYTPF